MYQNGQVVEGVITGIKPYGAFVKLDETHNGLLHISEISNDFIADINEHFTMKQTIKVKILDVGSDDHHFKLSLKAMQENGQRKKRNQAAHRLLPDAKLGFTTLEERLETWIQCAIKGDKYD